MRSRWDDDAGGVAAEFAVALPSVVIVLAICVGAIGVASQQLRLQDAAAVVARGLGRGEPVAGLTDRAERVAGASAVEHWASGGLVCVRLSRAASGPLAVGGLHLAAQSCALDGGS